MQNAIKYKALILLTAIVAFSGCRKIFDLPDEKDYLSLRADYTGDKTYRPQLGRTTTYTNIFNPDGSNFPMTFEIRNPRFGDGRDASDMLQSRPTLVWIGEYNGQEQSLAEIEAKRKIENRPMLEVRGSGDLVFWYTATRADIKPADSVPLPQDIRYIDMKITNSGGSKIIKDLAIIPRIDVPYWPDADYNQVTGKPNTQSVNSKVRVFNRPALSGITGESTNQNIPGDQASTGLVYTYIRKFTNDPNGHRLRIKILNRDSVPINPGLFNETKWANQVHGFNEAGTAPGYVINAQYVEYNVAYPIPLARVPTRFTSGALQGSGDNAHLELSYSRRAFGGVRQVGTIYQDFKIYEKGDWEIVFHFKTVNPKFDNE
jgi:hypothetical protein